MSKLASLAGVILVLNFALSGCATKRTAGWEKEQEVSQMNSKVEKELFKSAMVYWDKRDDKASLEKSLEIFEDLVKASPSNYQYLVYLCRGYYLLSDGHIQDMAEKKRLWEKGITWGERALTTNPAFKEKVVKVDGKIEDALDTLTKDNIEAIYWTAVNLGKWAKNSNIATVLKYKTRIKAMINRVGELDRNFFFGAFDRYWGTYYAVAPGFAGGDMAKSAESYEKSILTEKNYLGTYVLYAEVYATKKGDKKLFKEKLEYVLKADAGKVKAIAPENMIEKRKAKALLAKMKELF